MCHLPGARVKDVTRGTGILKGDGEQPEITAHIGTNEIGRKRKEALQPLVSR